ncbi:MAG: hypothetical protein CMK59_04475 [Proteobacteria bacterium]|nr:hypothetical protein [Pseudomonadota bacterium]
MSSEQSQLEQTIDSSIKKIRSLIDQDDYLVEEEKEKILKLTQEYGPKEIAQILEIRKPKELLPVQWELEELIEILDPPKPKKKEEDDDDPKNRRLRQSELEVVYTNPQAQMQILASKVDDRMVVVRINPYGQVVPEEYSGEEAADLRRQIGLPPYNPTSNR